MSAKSVHNSVLNYICFRFRSMPRILRVITIIALLFAVMLTTLHVIGEWQDQRVHAVLHPSEGRKRLAVLVHGLGGRDVFEPTVSLTHEALPDSDLLVFDYPAG